LPALDPDGDIDGVAGLAYRWLLLQSLVRTVAVLVPGVLGQRLAEMLPGRHRNRDPVVAHCQLAEQAEVELGHPRIHIARVNAFRVLIKR